MTRRLLLLALVLVPASILLADGPGDNIPDKVRKIPPPGIKVSEADAKALQAGLDELGKELTGLNKALKGKPALRELVPDVEIFHTAVRYALQYDEFHNPREVKVARELLDEGKQRAAQLRQGKAPWLEATGLVVRGYRSKIDGSAQPYGLVVPASFAPSSPHEFRLDCWFHGRGEKLSELSFINGRMRSPGQFTPRNTFVLHPYGRYSNANKMAGEADLFEAIAHVRKYYPIDENRVSVRGFSMGGAACWQFAVHYPGHWAGAAPGAGFSETPEFLRVFQKEELKPTWYEKKLWHMYDCTDYALNLFNCPTIAYSGEVDRQKQAADIMAEAMAKEGMQLVHIIGSKTGHGYERNAKAELERRFDALVNRGRAPLPRHIRFTTYTLRYHECRWLELDQLEEHWERALVDARIIDDNNFALKTQNVAGLTLSMPPGACPLDNTKLPKVTIDGVTLNAAPVLSDRSWTAHFRKTNGKWASVAKADDGSLRKRPGLQGPIDDAFWDSFIMVRPTGKPLNDAVGKWSAAEMKHAVTHWRQQFRGDARLKDDTQVNEDDIANSNLVLWGDPQSNKLLAKILDRLPIEWDAKNVKLGAKSFAADQHVPVLIYPNPLNPKRYVVLNSGFTYREYDYLNNARQVPKLPDFAVIDVSKPMTSQKPGGIADAGFFDERWQLKRED